MKYIAIWALFEKISNICSKRDAWTRISTPCIDEWTSDRKELFQQELLNTQFTPFYFCKWSHDSVLLNSGHQHDFFFHFFFYQTKHAEEKHPSSIWINLNLIEKGTKFWMAPTNKKLQICQDHVREQDKRNNALGNELIKMQEDVQKLHIQKTLPRSINT